MTYEDTTSHGSVDRQSRPHVERCGKQDGHNERAEDCTHKLSTDEEDPSDNAEALHHDHGDSYSRIEAAICQHSGHPNQEEMHSQSSRDTEEDPDIDHQAEAKR